CLVIRLASGAAARTPRRTSSASCRQRWSCCRLSLRRGWRRSRRRPGFRVRRSIGISPRARIYVGAARRRAGERADENQTDALRPPGELAGGRTPLDVADVLNKVPPHLLGDQIVAAAQRLGGVGSGGRAIGVLLAAEAAEQPLVALGRQAAAALALANGYTDVFDTTRRRKET